MRPMRALRFAALLLVACAKTMPPPAPLSVGPQPAKASATASSRLEALARRYWQTLLETAPVPLVFDGGIGGPLFATALGDHRFDARLDDFSPAARRKLRDALAQLRSEADTFEASSLSADEKLTLEILRGQLADEIAAESCEGELWVVDQMNGPQAQLPQTWMYYPLGTPQGAADLASRYAQAGRMFDQMIANLRRGSFQNKVAARANVERTIASLDVLLAKDAAQSVLLPPAAKFAALPQAAREPARERIRRAIADEALPGFRRYRDFLAGELLPRARGDAGIWALPGGEACYRALVAHHTGTQRTPQDLNDLGQRLLSSIELEMAQVAQAGGAPARADGKVDVAAYRKSLDGRADLFKRTPEALLKWNEATLARALAALPQAFRTMPPRPIETRPIEAYRAAANVPAFYQPAPDDGSQPAIYYVNTFRPETRPLYNEEALCFHETVPGHHLQGTIAQELQGLPDFRRQTGPTAYVEGWALYAERLADDMHLYSGDPARFGMLGYQAWRAARLVVDTGMHALHWDREKALQFLREHTTLAPDEAANEIDRYVAMPAQALGYMIGEVEFFQLRQRARERLGARFDLKAFHEVVLGHGAVPMPALARIVDEWIASSP
jgi:uncharacterized protein (DUF885 family)